MSYFEVEFCTHVDHPERRDASFVRRDEHRQADRWRYETQGAAVGVFDEMVKGQWDCVSEYICWVQVYHVRQGQRARCVRKRVDRERPARWAYDLTPCPEGTRGWSLNDGTPFIYCETCKLTLDEGFPCKHVDQAELEAWLAVGGEEIRC